MYVEYFFPSWLHVIFLQSARDWSKWSSPPFSKSTLKNIQGISHRLSEVFKLQLHAKLCTKCRILLISSSNFSPPCLWKSLVLVECCFCHGNSVFYFTCTCYTVLFSCYKSSWNILHPSVAFDVSQSALGMAALILIILLLSTILSIPQHLTDSDNLK